MNPLEIIALADAALTLAEKADKIYKDAKAEGIVTESEQDAAHSEYLARRKALLERMGKDS